MRLSAKLSIVLLLGCFCFLLSSCHAQEPVEEEAPCALERVMRCGVLRVVTVTDLPWVSEEKTDGNGQPVLSGADMELAAYLALEMGVKLEVHASDLEDLSGVLSRKEADLALAGLVPTASRSASMLLSQPYYEDIAYEHYFLVREGQESRFSREEDFRSGLIAVRGASLSLEVLQERLPQAELRLSRTWEDAFCWVEEGLADAVLVSGDLDLVAQELGYRFCRAAYTLEVPCEGYVAAVAPGEELWLDKLDELLTQVREKDLYSSWLESQWSVGG